MLARSRPSRYKTNLNDLTSLLNTSSIKQETIFAIPNTDSSDRTEKTRNEVMGILRKHDQTVTLDGGEGLEMKDSGDMNINETPDIHVPTLKWRALSDCITKQMRIHALDENVTDEVIFVLTSAVEIRISSLLRRMRYSKERATVPPISEKSMGSRGYDAILNVIAYLEDEESKLNNEAEVRTWMKKTDSAVSEWDTERKPRRTSSCRSQRN